MGLLVPRAPRGFPSIPAEPPPRQAQQEPAHSSFTSAGASRGAFSCEDTAPLQARGRACACGQDPASGRAPPSVVLGL